jgi:hypothetical protein
MYIIIAPIQIKPGFKDQFIAAVTEDAQGRTSSSFATPSRTGVPRDRRGQAAEHPTSGLQIVNGHDLTREPSL